MKNRFFLFCILCIVATVTKAQTGILKGKIQSETGYYLSGISITLDGTSFGTTTNEEGTFELKKIPAGSYVLVVSGVSYKTTKNDVVVIANEVSYLNLVLNITDKTLGEVLVKGNKPSAYIIKSTSTALKQNIPLLETPHSISVVTQQLIKDQVIVDFQQTLRNVTGVQPSYAGAGYQMVQKARGFEQRTFFRDGIPFTTNNIRDMANIEQVEVMRGPSGTLFGGGNINGPGALINVITKKPLDNFYGAVGITGGSFSFFRPTIDISSPLNTEKTALFRINMAAETDRGFKQLYSRQSFFVAPSFSYRLDTKNTLDFDFEYFSRDEADVTYPIPLDVIPIWPRNINAVNDGGSAKTKTFAGTIRLSHQFNSNWKSIAAFQFSGQSLDNASAAAYMDDDTLATRYLYARQTDDSYYFLQYYLNGKFTTGKVEHDFVAGVDGYYYKENYYRNGRFVSYDQVNLKSGIFPAIPLSAFEQCKWRAVKLDGDNRSVGLYVQDIIKPIPALSIVLGGRIDAYKQFDEKDIVAGTVAKGFTQNAFSPKVGLVFQPILHKLSVFGNYTSGYDFLTGKDFDGNAFKPMKYNQVEGGVKAELLNGRFVPTLSVYQIKAEDVLRPDPAHAGFSIQDGLQTSKGWELEFAGSPARGLNIAAGYAHNSSIFTRADSSVQGKHPNAMPPNVLNFWASYNVVKGKLSGLGIGAGANYVDDNYMLPDNVVVVPKYTIFNAAIFYSKSSYRLSVKMDNLADKYYYISTYGSVDPGMPRRILGSVTIYF